MKLPVDDILPELDLLLSRQPTLVLEAPPGAGKTTRVPPALLDSAWLAGQKILMLEPRRLAARNAAEFMARQMGEAVGQTVGYSIRFEHKTSLRTRIEVITEGILTRRLQSDPELSGVGLVIFDEFHERNIHSDIALALTNDLRKGLREELRILVMSATLDSAPIVKLLEAAQLRSEGRTWPVETIHLGGEILQNCVGPMCMAITRAVRETDGDILAFLPGAYEIEQLHRSLSKDFPQLMICPLHSRLSQRDQQKALKKKRPTQTDPGHEYRRDQPDYRWHQHCGRQWSLPPTRIRSGQRSHPPQDKPDISGQRQTTRRSRRPTARRNLLSALGRVDPCGPAAPNATGDPQRRPGTAGARSQCLGPAGRIATGLARSAAGRRPRSGAPTPHST